MSETKSDETQSQPEATDANVPHGAVDTGRRIDPALLKGAAPAAGTRTIRRERPEDQKAGSDAPPDAPVASPVEAKSEKPAQPEKPAQADAPRGPRGDDRGPRGDDRGPRRDGPGRPGGPGGPGRPGQGRDDKRGGKGPRRDDRSDARKPAGPRVGPRDDGPRDIFRAPTPTEDIGDFAAMLAESGPVDHVRLTVGDRVKAKVVHVSKDTIFFQLTGTQEAFMPTAELLDEEGNVTVKVGDTIESFVVSLAEGILLSRKLGRGEVDVGMLEQAKISGIPVDGTVTAVNKGGVEVQLAGTRGFCPTGQLDVNFIEDTSTLIGKTLGFLIREVKEGGRQLVLSRKALLERERKEQSKKLLETLAVGQVLEGQVTRIQPFGVFVDLGGIDGLIPMGELSYARVQNAGDVVQIGERVSVEVKRIEENPKRQGELRIGLSLKATLPDPFIAQQGDLIPGSTVVGKVARIEAFGAFVELFPGVQGLIHVSELADKRVRHPEDVLKVDELVKVRVLDFDLANRRVSLSLREPQDLTSEEPSAPEQGGQGRPAKPAGLRRGAQVEGTVDRIEKYGVFVQIEGGGSAFLPASETGTPRGSDLSKALPIGTKLSLLVIDLDERGRLKVSKTAREQAEERALVNEYNTSSGANAGFGTFGDLLKKMKK